MNALILGLITLISTAASPLGQLAALPVIPFRQEITLARHDLDLTIREPDSFVNEVFRDNILLSLHYLKGGVSLPVDWNQVREPFSVTFTLKPTEVFTFHANTLPEFAHPTITMNSQFYMDEGYKAVGGLGGNGVCHLATLINWVAKDAGLVTVAKVNHDFAPVAGVPREFGVAILSQSAQQNLYVKNNQDFPVVFRFSVTPQNVNLTLLRG